ncbi:hypothetical protein SEVIR_2G206700v4 [Setaria viridis]|uniref:Uncharacterized protein n=2 Tax=Setaria TaxID=4554 RepID=A0A368Q130_SETIT|nr:hypothetical protein SETIT_2G198500v2 [Setaria italica]TKW33033.1 hypothetical protein SEVIR_2G206700v2 [Setaria viridis]
MKTGSNGSGAGAAAATVLLAALLMLVAASMSADAAAAPRRLREPGPNPCTNDPNNPGRGCHSPHAGKQAATAQTEAQPRRLISFSKASAGPSGCTHDPSAPPGKKCPPLPPKAP